MAETNKKAGGKRRVGFSPNLAGQAAPHPQPAGSNTWDTEQDHILSYLFDLDGTGGQHAHQQQHAAHQQANLPAFASTGTRPSGAVASGHRGGAMSRSGRCDKRSDTENESDDGGAAPPPPTPAIHYYSHSATTSAGSSSRQQPQDPVQHHPTPNQMMPPPPPQAPQPGQAGPLSHPPPITSMAQSLVSGGPLIYQQMQLQQQQRQMQLQQQQQQRGGGGGGGVGGFQPAPGHASPMDFKDASPISPAEMIGTGFENLMLPPPGLRAPLQDHQPSIPQQPRMPTKEEQEQHMAWLAHLNAIAKSQYPAGSTAYNSTAPGPAAHQQRVLSTQPMPPGSMPQQQQQAGAAIGHPNPMQPNMIPVPRHHPGIPPHAMMYHAAVVAAASAPAEPPSPASIKEAEEKRAKRLERNRESARASRRRKKDKLTGLEAEVAGLHAKLDRERKKHVSTMVPSLQQCRLHAISRFMREDTGGTSDILSIIRNSGPYSQISQHVLEFQYATLNQLLLPRYQKMLLWFTLPDDKFFTVGKENYLKRKSAAGKQTPRSSSGKISSKQVGDDLTNGPGADDSHGPPLSRDEDANTTDADLQTAYANDGARMWPLFCFEMRSSVDQEERFVAVQKQLRERRDLDLPKSRSQITAAVRTANQFRHAVEQMSRVVSNREEAALLQTLSPGQVSAYQNWLASNRGRCHRAIGQRRMAGGVDQTAVSGDNGEPAVLSDAKERSLDDICRRLSEVMHISSKGDESVDKS